MELNNAQHARLHDPKNQNDPCMSVPVQYDDTNSPFYYISRIVNISESPLQLGKEQQSEMQILLYKALISRNET